MPIFTSETVLSVSDYRSFEDAEDAVNDAIDQFREDYPGVKVLGATFLEFDSSNRSHAGAYFEVRYRAKSPVDDE